MFSSVLLTSDQVKQSSITRSSQKFLFLHSSMFYPATKERYPVLLFWVQPVTPLDQKYQYSGAHQDTFDAKPNRDEIR